MIAPKESPQALQFLKTSKAMYKVNVEVLYKYLVRLSYVSYFLHFGWNAKSSTDSGLLLHGPFDHVQGSLQFLSGQFSGSICITPILRSANIPQSGKVSLPWSRAKTTRRVKGSGCKSCSNSMSWHKQKPNGRGISRTI